VLKVKVDEDPEAVLQLSARDLGSLVHAVLEQFVAAAIERGAPPPGTPWSTADRTELLAVLDEAGKQAEAEGLTGKRLLWDRARRALERDTEGWLVADAHQRTAWASTPIAVEAPFGFGDQPPVSLQLPGRTVTMRGVIDRVDRTAAGGLVVLDYKTGKSDSYKKLSSDDPLLGGSLLQLPLYALAADALFGGGDAGLQAYYWFVSARGRFETKGYAVTPAVLETFRRTIGAILDGIDAGVFPPRPPAPKSFRLYVECAFCDPDALGTTDAFHRWERKKHDPALAGYLALIEPPDGLL
jgi:ATP-dependent helicase/nuclease subunit B